MSNNNSSSSSSGIGFLGVLFIAFLVLKLCHVIDWSWWWITAPLWGIPAILIAIGVVYVIVTVLLWSYKKIHRKLWGKKYVQKGNTQYATRGSNRVSFFDKVKRWVLSLFHRKNRGQ